MNEFEEDTTGLPPAPEHWRLQVFTGVHRGASVALEMRPWTLVGSAEDCDVVLRDAGVHAHHLLMSHDGAQWVLRALDAALQVDDQTLQAGQSRVLAELALCSVGSARFGVGPALSPRWSEVESYALSLASEAWQPAQLDAAVVDPAPAPVDDAPTPDAGRLIHEPPAASGSTAVTPRPPRTASRVVMALGVCLLIVMTGAFGWVVHGHTVKAQANRGGIEQVLSKLGLNEVKAVQAPNGHVQLQGTLPTEALRAKLQQALDAAGLAPTLDLVTGERLAAGVQDSFRQRGLAVDTQYVGGGKVVVKGAAASAQAEQVVRDVLGKTPSLHHIEFSPPEVAAAPAPGGADAPKPPQVGMAAVGGTPGSEARRDPKRVVAVVAGDPAYVLTQDGARYLTGAMLPDGSQIESVDGHIVTFTRNGNRVQVDF